MRAAVCLLAVMPGSSCLWALTPHTGRSASLYLDANVPYVTILTIRGTLSGALTRLACKGQSSGLTAVSGCSWNGSKLSRMLPVNSTGTCATRSRE